MRLGRWESIPIVEHHTKSMKFEDNLGYRAKHPQGEGFLLPQRLIHKKGVENANT